MCKASKRKSPNDAKRYIKSEYCTADGELAQIENFSLNQDMIDQESRFDGFRTMKTDLRARPVYLKRDDRIKAHFLTCFLSLLLYKYLEKKVNRYPKKS